MEPAPQPSSPPTAEPPPAGCTPPATALPPWLKVPYSQLSQRARMHAEHWQSALLSALERLGRPGFTFADAIRAGIDGTKRVFGKPMSDRQVRRMLERVQARDAGRHEWHNPELFVEADAAPLRSSPELAAQEDDLAELSDVLENLASPGSLTLNEEGRLWTVARSWYAGRLDSAPAKRLKAQLIGFLSRRAPWLAPTRNALRVLVGRKFLNPVDGRRAKRGQKRKPEVPQADALKIASYATFNTGGRLAQAGRELANMREASGLDASTLDALDHEGSKDYVNRRVAQVVQPLIRAAAPHMLGKKAVDDATPSLTRDYSKLRSMQVITADDYTLPVYFTVPDGKGWFTLTRGQCLLFIDVRSLKIIT